MFSDTKAFNGFAVDDLEKARKFYGETLGIKTTVVDEQNGLMSLHLAGDRETLVYRKEDLEPGNYTILNFTVDNIDAAVDGLAERGVDFERYGDFDQDGKGVFRGIGAGMGPDIAWFKDPAGNILAVMQEA